MPIRLNDLDKFVLRHVVSQGGARLSRSVTVLGSPKLMLSATALCCALCARAGKPSVRPLATLGTGLVVRHTLCALIRRARPPERWWHVEPDGYSFPSKHVTTAVLGTSGLLTLLGDPPGRVARRSATATVVVVAISRLRLGVHWPTDVLGGLLFGKCWLWLTRLMIPIETRR